jgi:DNA-binding CsgD family transcriptional regulator
MSGERTTYERLRLLTPKERDCLRLVMEQRSSKEIAREFGISRTSVDTHVRRALHKLGLRDRYAAARLLETWRQSGTASAAGESKPATPPLPLPSPAPSSLRMRLPPLASLGLGQRLYLVVGGAVMAAALTGTLLIALAAL